MLERPRTFHDTATLTLYGLYSYQWMGPGYVRHLGVANIGDAGTGEALSGAGNASPVSGTGHHWHAALGLLLDLAFGGVQPYLTCTLSKFESYAEMSPTLGGGVNYHVMGHHAKLTLNVQARPIWTSTERLSHFATEGVLQTQLYF
jgi:hypothetical protein